MLFPLLLRASYPGKPQCELSGDKGLSMSQGKDSWRGLKGGWADTMLVQDVVHGKVYLITIVTTSLFGALIVTPSITRQVH